MLEYPIFNVGDKVECIEGCGGITSGHQYTVTKFWSNPSDGEHMIEIGTGYVFFTRRFKLVELDIVGDDDDDCI